MGFEIRDDGYAERVRESFAQQGFMQTIGARLRAVEPGRVTIEMELAQHVGQQRGSAHAGAVAAIMDSAAGYAALTLTSVGTEIVSVEFKVNMLAPALGDRIVASAEVLRPGRRVTVCRADAHAFTGEEERLVATMLATMAPVPDRGD